MAFFTAVFLGTRVKLEILATHLVAAAKRLFGAPNFRLNALPEGIREIRARSARPRSTTLNDLSQLTFGFRSIPGKLLIVF